MLFEVLNALTSFQSYINKILTDKLDVFVIVYLNNILLCMNKNCSVEFIQ